MSAYRFSLFLILKKEVSEKIPQGRQAFIATWLFDPSMLALPIVQKQNSDSVGLFNRQ